MALIRVTGHRIIGDLVLGARYFSILLHEWSTRRSRAPSFFPPSGSRDRKQDRELTKVTPC